VIFQNIYSPKKKTEIKIKQTKYFFFSFGGARQGLTLLLSISIRDRESGLRSSFKKWFVWNVWYFFFESFIYFFLYFWNI